MDVIKSIKDLPAWFKEDNYKRKLDAADWYREIRKRQVFIDALRLLEKNSPSGHMTDGANQIFNVIHKPSLKDKELYCLGQYHSPVRDMTKLEAMCVAACLKDARSEEAYQDFRELITSFKPPRNRLEYPAHYERHDAKLKMFHIKYCDESDSMREPVHTNIAKTKISFETSLERPLDGYPVVIDTNFDDETLLASFKEWLKTRRKENNGKITRRPFRQNDFDDLAYFRVREIFDLESWASFNNVKIQDKVIVAALWPHASEDISPLDILRTTARKKAKETFRLDVCIRLYRQLVNERGENFLSQ